MSDRTKSRRKGGGHKTWRKGAQEEWEGSSLHINSVSNLVEKSKAPTLL